LQAFLENSFATRFVLFLEGFKQDTHFSHLRGHNQALGLEFMRQLNILLSLQF
jgi:hypothetical protein